MIMHKRVISVSLIILLFLTGTRGVLAQAAYDETDNKFNDIEKIEADIIDAPITIMESDVKEITVSNTVKNTGIGFITQPKVSKKGNVLCFDQGYAIGYNTKSTGSVLIELPKGLSVDIDIKSGSGDVNISTSKSNNISLDVTVGEKIISSQGENLFIDSVSGDIDIDGVFVNTEIETVNSDVEMKASASTDKIYYKSISGNADIYVDEVKGYNLFHKYAGGKTDEYFSVDRFCDKIIDINGDTVDGSINVIGNS